jgi:hypothetical protein
MRDDMHLPLVDVIRAEKSLARLTGHDHQDFCGSTETLDDSALSSGRGDEDCVQGGGDGEQRSVTQFENAHTVFRAKDPELMLHPHEVVSAGPSANRLGPGNRTDLGLGDDFRFLAFPDIPGLA